MSQETIQLAYDGEALREGSMSVRDLAPALLAIGNLCEQANSELNGDRAEISVKVRSDFKTGSFELKIDVSQKIIEAARFLFTHKEQVTTAKELLEIIGLASVGMSVPSVGLFKLIKWLKGRTATKTIVLENGNTRIYVENSPNTHIEVKPGVVNLYNNESIRKSSFDVVKPLESTGIDTFEVRGETDQADIIKKEDLSSFLIDPIKPVESPLIENERNAALVVIKPSFEDGLKWMFSDGESRFSAAMMDSDFLEKLSNRQISFTKGDVLVVHLFTKSYQTPTGLRTEYKIDKVIEIKPAPRQLSLLPPPIIE